MALFSRKNMARGVKMVTEQVYKLPEDIAAALAAVTVDQSNIEKNAGLVELHFTLTALDRDYFVTTDTTIQYLLPFCLPPLQESFSLLGAVESPRFRLEHLTFGFDTSCEAAAVTERHGTPGMVDYAGAQALDLRLMLSEKAQWFSNQSTTQNWPEREVLNLPLPPTAYADEVARLNPLVLADLAIDLDPYKTYVLSIAAPRLRSTIGSYALPAVHLSLGIRAELVERDKGAGIQNLPSHLGAQAGETVTISRPAKNTTIRANGSSGIVNGALWLVDQVLSRKLTGGYSKDGRPSFKEHIKTDACYDVLALPFFGNEKLRAVVASDPTSLHYAGVAPYTAYTQDERRLPIYHPMTIHHVVAICNYARPADEFGVLGPSQVPTSATLSNHVGVGIVATGDSAGYEQVAQLQWNGNQPTKNLIDRVVQCRNSPAVNGDWSHELRAVPLTMRAAEAGVGYYAQGKPFYIGKGSSMTTTRTNVGTRVSGGNAAPLTGGRESYLYARWAMIDTVGMSTTVAVPPGAAAANETTYVGYGGHWLLIFGKRHLVGADNDLP